MSWAQRLKSWASGEPGEQGNADLVGLRADLEREARRLARHAELAPNASAEGDLSRLAKVQDAIAARLHEALGEKGAAAAAPVEASPPAGLNHWARLVQNLEHARSQRDRLFDAAKERTTEPLGDLAEELALRMDDQVLGLRALIARADPQALD
jgi:hypothetical protein